MNVVLNQGWQCPKCAKIWAPHIGACGACNSRQTLPFDQYLRPARTGDYVPPMYRFTCEAPQWNFNGDDLSYT